MGEHNPNFKESAGISSVPTHPEFHLISRASYFYMTNAASLDDRICLRDTSNVGNQICSQFMQVYVDIGFPTFQKRISVQRSTHRKNGEGSRDPIGVRPCLKAAGWTELCCLALKTTGNGRSLGCHQSG
jgi:hypothetical protein